MMSTPFSAQQFHAHILPALSLSLSPVLLAALKSSVAKCQDRECVRLNPSQSVITWKISNGTQCSWSHLNEKEARGKKSLCTCKVVHMLMKSIPALLPNTKQHCRQALLFCLNTGSHLWNLQHNFTLLRSQKNRAESMTEYIQYLEYDNIFTACGYLI